MSEFNCPFCHHPFEWNSSDGEYISCPHCQCEIDMSEMLDADKEFSAAEEIKDDFNDSAEQKPFEEKRKQQSHKTPVQNQYPANQNNSKTSKKDNSFCVIGCLFFVIWLFAFFISGWNYPNSNDYVYIFFSLPAFLLIAGVIYAIKKVREEKKIPESLMAGIVVLILIAAVIAGIVFMCRSCSGDSMENKVEEKAFGIVYLSTGRQASGFRFDSTIISGDKAVCHFRYKINGEERLCSIEFKIENGEPVPTGNFVLDEN